MLFCFSFVAPRCCTARYCTLYFLPAGNAPVPITYSISIRSKTAADKWLTVFWIVHFFEIVCYKCNTTADMLSRRFFADGESIVVRSFGSLSGAGIGRRHLFVDSTSSYFTLWHLSDCVPVDPQIIPELPTCMYLCLVLSPSTCHTTCTVAEYNRQSKAHPRVRNAHKLLNEDKHHQRGHINSVP